MGEEKEDGTGGKGDSMEETLGLLGKIGLRGSSSISKKYKQERSNVMYCKFGG